MTREVSKEEWSAQQGHREMAKGIKQALLGAHRLNCQFRETSMTQISLKSFQFEYEKKLGLVAQQFATEYGQLLEDKRTDKKVVRRAA